MYLFDARQIREWDLQTMKALGISSTQLMEKAGQALAKKIIELFPSPDTRFLVVCGTGNNGGDGLVIARILRNHFYTVRVLECPLNKTPSADYQIMKEQLLACHNIPIADFDELKKDNTEQNTIIIDALLGTGINRVVEGQVLDIIKRVNQLGWTTISIDLPSGMILEPMVSTHCIEADITLTIQAQKLPFFIEENVDKTGTVFVIDIGLTDDYKATSPYEFIDAQMAISFLEERKKVSHKSHYGHSAIIAGSEGKAGAAILATNACSRSGAGYVSILSRETVVNQVIQVVPEAMSLSLPSSSLEEKLVKYKAVGIGCGIGFKVAEKKLLTTLLQNFDHPILLDADALTLLAEDKSLLSFLSHNTVLTPHPGEFDRLFGRHTSHEERIKTQMKQSKELGCFIVLKTSHTSISTPDGKLIFNTTGNPGMAKAGSGDVLLGLMTGFAARYSTLEKAICLAVYMHGLAGDLAACELGVEAMKAGDIIGYIPKAFTKLVAVETNVLPV